MGSGSSDSVPFNCIGIAEASLATGSGSCVMNCPASCTITSNVADPCGSSNSAGGGDTTTTTTYEESTSAASRLGGTATSGVIAALVAGGVAAHFYA